MTSYVIKMSEPPVLTARLSIYNILIFQAGLALWITILRFMGDLPEPKYHTMDKVNHTTVVPSTKELPHGHIGWINIHNNSVKT